MSRGRFLELLRGALCQSGLDVAAAQRATFNRLRRFVPTIANVMKLPALDLQAVGSWTELPQGGGADPQVAKAHAIVPMGLHYAGGKTARSAQVKQRCLCRPLQIFHARSSDWARSPEGLLVPHCWKWPEFEAMIQSIPEAVVEQPVELKEIQPDETPAEGRIEVAEGALPREEEPDFGTDGEKKAHPKPLLARFKSAYEAGLKALRAATDPAQKAEDPDEPLPETTMTQMNTDWTKRYSLQFEANLEPSETLRGRIYREFKRGTMSVIEAKKIRSVLHMAAPRLNETVDLAGGIQLNFQTESVVAVRSVTAYYYALRTLAHAWAWAGNYLVKRSDGSQTLMMDLSSALGYCDRAMQDTFTYGQGSMAWMERNDTLTRGKMSTLIRRGFTAAEALHEALRETHLEWRSPAAMVPVGEIAPPVVLWSL